MSDLISRLSELRSQYNCFDKAERDAYHTLSEAIEAVSRVPSAQPEPCEDAVSRTDVVDMLEMFPFTEYSEYETAREVVKRLPSVTPKCPECDDAVSREAAIDVAENAFVRGLLASPDIRRLPSAQPTLHGYNIEHLELIARVLQKEDLPPERIVEALKDIGRIVAIVKDEFEESLRKAVEQCKI